MTRKKPHARIRRAHWHSLQASLHWSTPNRMPRSLPQKKEGLVVRWPPRLGPTFSCHAPPPPSAWRTFRNTLPPAPWARTARHEERHGHVAARHHTRVPTRASPAPFIKPRPSTPPLGTSLSYRQSSTQSTSSKQAREERRPATRERWAAGLTRARSRTRWRAWTGARS